MIKKLTNALLGILILGQVVANAAEKEVDRVVARINNEVILLSEFNKRAEPIINEYQKSLSVSDREEKIKLIKEELLSQMIDEKLLLQESQAKDIYVSDTELDNGVDEIKERFGTEMEFQNELSGQGYSGEKFRQNIAEQLKVIKLINQEVKSKVSVPTEEDTRKYYKDNEEEMVSPEAVEARHILIRTDDKSEKEALEKTNEIYKKVKNSSDKFSKYAEEYSEGPSSARGGSLGYFSRGEMVEEFEDAAFDLRVGDITKPVKTMFGYHIIKVTGRKSSEKKTFAEARDTLKNLLYQERMKEKYETFLRNLRDEAKVSKQLFKSE
ncbi:MAG: peptidylprolyl isomerase [Elusimicrobia bacterium]|nr:peptidylprolyl isomerase [Elusimicrobiota bacterium]